MATDHNYRREEEDPGMYRSTCIIPEGLLNRRKYIIGIDCDVPSVSVLMPFKEYLSFTVFGGGNQASYFPEEWPGVVCPRFDWKVEKFTEVDEFHLRKVV